MIFLALPLEYTSATTSNSSKHHASIIILAQVLHFSEEFREHSCHKYTFSSGEENEKM